jgi:DNA-binding transcriptional MocR family regulator
MGRPPLTQFTDRAGVIDLGWGHPDPDLLPVEGLRSAADRALARWGADALGYGAGAGPYPLIDEVRQRLAAVDGRAPAADEVLVTAGNSWAIDQVATLLTRPGDAVLVESPTYHLAVRILSDHPVEVVPLPFDGEGLVVDAIPETLAALRSRGRRVALLYSVPTFHNPTGVSLSAARRRALVKIAAREGLLVLEDDAYRELAYDAPLAPPSLWSEDGSGSVVRLGSFAKSLAPGLRSGYLTADPAIVARFAEGGLLDSGGGISHFASLVVAEYLRSGSYATNVERLRAAYRERRDVLLEALARGLPGATVAAPAGGFFVWLTLAEPLTARAALDGAEREGVSFVPGHVFDVTRSDPLAGRSLRLSFSRYPPDVLAEAARRLGRAVAHDGRGSEAHFAHDG